MFTVLLRSKSFNRHESPLHHHEQSLHSYHDIALIIVVGENYPLERTVAAVCSKVHKFTYLGGIMRSRDLNITHLMVITVTKLEWGTELIEILHVIGYVFFFLVLFSVQHDRSQKNKFNFPVTV